MKQISPRKLPDPERVRELIQRSGDVLRTKGYDPLIIEPGEFIDYLTGPTPTGDTTTLEDMLGMRYLTIHELVEASELKRMGVALTSSTVMEHHPEVYVAHMVAFDLELSLAKDEGNHDWVEQRLSLVDSWLEDESMPERLVRVCDDLKKKYSESKGENRSSGSLAGVGWS